VAGFVAVNLTVAAFTSPVGVPSDDDGGDAGAGEDEAAADDGAPSPESFLMDPQLFETEDGQWAVGSSTDGITMPLMEVTDDGTARQVGDALSGPPGWASQGFVGPSVVEVDGTWWLLFAAQADDTGRYCLGAASTTDVSEGFAPTDSPLLCTEDRDVVDPSVYQGDDGLVLTWAERTAGTAATDPSTDTTATEAADTWRIDAAPLDLEDASLGETSVLLTGDAGGWEAGVVDGPALVDVGDTLVLLYSGNQWGTELYAAGYAVCESTSSACERRSVDAPLDVPTDEAAGDLTTVASLQPVVGEDDEAAGFALSAAADGQSVPVALRAPLSWRDDALAVGTATPIEVAG
jgi:arabinan endo-1,5-alpha-L-arabinosidase